MIGKLILMTNIGTTEVVVANRQVPSEMAIAWQIAVNKTGIGGEFF